MAAIRYVYRHGFAIHAAYFYNLHRPTDHPCLAFHF